MPRHLRWDYASCCLECNAAGASPCSGRVAANGGTNGNCGCNHGHFCAAFRAQHPYFCSHFAPIICRCCANNVVDNA